MLEVAARLVLGGILAGASLAQLASPASRRAALASFGIVARRSQAVVFPVLIHPECGCSTQAMEYVASGDVDSDGVHMLSTSGMLHPCMRPTGWPSAST